MAFAGTQTPRKPTGEAKWQLPMRRGESGILEFFLDGEHLERFCKLFPRHSNRRMMQWFGISYSTLQRFKHKLGLSKDMKAIRKELAKDVKKICEENGYYDSIRGVEPSPQCKEASAKKRAEGFHPITALKAKNPRRYRALMKRRSAQRSELIMSERRRVEIGLDPRTKLRPAMIGEVRKYSRSETSRRSSALKRGYILGYPDTERYCIFYDAETNRSEVFERNCTACGFSVSALD